MIIKNGRIVKKNIHSSLQNKNLRVNNPFDLQLKKNLENTVLAHQMSDIHLEFFILVALIAQQSLKLCQNLVQTQ